MTTFAIVLIIRGQPGVPPPFPSGLTVQTFLPYPNSKASAKALDPRRLGKQRVEAIQLLLCLLSVPAEDGEKPAAWSAHPAAKMWASSPFALAAYTLAVCEEWKFRGYSDGLALGARVLLGLAPATSAINSTLASVRRIGSWVRACGALRPAGPPPWWGSPAFHASHRSNLIRKDPIFYGQWNWSEPADLPYIWPTTDTTSENP